MPISNDPRFSDPMSRAPAGYSLTQPRGKWAWEKPPRFVDPNEAVSYAIDQIEKPRATQRIIKLMLAGVTIEELVNSISIGGFSTGNFTPDVAELIKGPLVMYLMGVADDNNIPVKVFSTPNGAPPGDDDLDDITILEIMKKRNPKVFRELLQTNNQIEQEVLQQMSRNEERMGGFLGMEEPEDFEMLENEVPEQEGVEQE